MPLEFQPRTRLADPSWFYKRDADLQRLFAYLAKDHPQNVSLVGQRRIGKSWLLQAIAQDDNLRREFLKQRFEQFTFIYWDLQLQRQLTPDSFLARQLEIISESLPAEVRDLLAEQIAGKDIEDALVEMLKLLEVAGHHVVLLLDEFDRIMGKTDFAEEFFSHLCNLFSGSYLILVTASYHTLAEICNLGQDSPFFNIFSKIQLGLLSDAEAQDFVTQAFKSCEITLEPGAMKEIIRLAGPNPCFISILCHDLYHTAPHDRALVAADVQALASGFQMNVVDDYQYFTENLDDNGRSMLLNICEGNAPTALTNPVYIKLKSLGLVVEHGGKSEPFSAAFGQYVREIKGADVYFQKAFSDPELTNPNFVRLCDVVLKTAGSLPQKMAQDLQAAVQAIRSRPQDAMRICGRDVLPVLIDRVYAVELKARWNGDIFGACDTFNQRAEAKQFSMHIAAHFHSIRISGNHGSHDYEYIQACTPARAFLTVLETIHLAEEVYKRYP
jgi:hypothetical protein